MSAARGVGLRALLALAWPIVVSRSTQVVVGIADAVLVAPLGASALAATTAGAINSMALFILPMGTVFIVSSFSSQLSAKGDLASARRYGWYGLAIAAATQVVAIATAPLVGLALAPLGYDGVVRSGMEGYLAIRLLSGGAVVGMEALANYYGGLGDTRRPMRASVLAMALNVLLLWILVGGRLGAPALGVRGAALANVIATVVGFLWLLASFLRERRAEGAGALRWAELRRTLRFGLPSGVNWFTEFMAYAVFVNVVVAGLGTTPLAAMMSVMQVNSVAFMPSFGLASAGAILVGQAIGAGAKDRVPGVVWLTFKVAAAWQFLVAAFYVLAPALVLAPFAGDPASAEFLAVGRRTLYGSAMWVLFDAAFGVIAEALRAAGDTAFTMWIRAGIAWAVWVPASWYAVRKLGGGDVAATGALVAYLALLAIAVWLRFRSGAWRRIELTGEAGAGG
jgi:MATE family multidrug resistance protein